MLKNIKSNLSTTNIVDLNNLDTKIYISFKSLLMTCNEYNNFFQTIKSTFNISSSIQMHIAKNSDIDFFDEDQNEICKYIFSEKKLSFAKYYQTDEIEKKMKSFILKKTAIICNELNKQIQQEILRRQNKLLSTLEEKDDEATILKDKPSTDIEKKVKEKPPIIPTQNHDELIIEDDFIIMQP